MDSAHYDMAFICAELANCAPWFLTAFVVIIVFVFVTSTSWLWPRDKCKRAKVEAKMKNRNGNKNTRSRMQLKTKIITKKTLCKQNEKRQFTAAKTVPQLKLKSDVKAWKMCWIAQLDVFFSLPLNTLLSLIMDFNSISHGQNENKRNRVRIRYIINLLLGHFVFDHNLCLGRFHWITSNQLRLYQTIVSFSFCLRVHKARHS